MTDSDTPCGEAAVGASTAEEVGADEEGEDADEVDVVAAGGEDAVVVQNKQNDCRKMNKEHGIMIGEKQEMAGRILSDPTLCSDHSSLQCNTAYPLGQIFYRDCRVMQWLRIFI